MKMGEIQRAANRLIFGADLLDDGSTRFRLWAPGARKAQLVLSGQPDVTLDATAQDDGFYELTTSEAKAGSAYRWKLDDDLLVPDPASRFNPEGPHSPSVVVDPANYQWQIPFDGRPWSEAVIYEMHVGTFSPEGTYRAAMEKLGELEALGVTAIELMPLSTFSGEFGWGYDGVLPYAPYAGYGSPDDLKAFVDAAHSKNLMVFLDVVYNHFGPDGSFVSQYAQSFYTDKHKTPWGDSFNFDGEHSHIVREYFIHNALYWLGEYRFDGLRFDAVHAIHDDSPTPLMTELGHRVREQFPERKIHLILENENNEEKYLLPQGTFHQWNDDFHHALHVALTGESAGYYQDYQDKPAQLVARALAKGFLWKGSQRNQKGQREDLVQAPPQFLPAMVNYLTNHDQTGNRAYGERLAKLFPDQARPLATALWALSPATPMIFAGEEFAATTPFQYFADYCGVLGDSVTQGRKEEFGHFADDTDHLPPPCQPETFEASKLNWEEARAPLGRAQFSLIQRLLHLRKEYFQPMADDLCLEHDFHCMGEHSFFVRWKYKNGKAIELSCHLSAAATPACKSPWADLSESQLVYRTGTQDKNWWSPWSATWTVGKDSG